jgi:hypothetical protein
MPFDLGFFLPAQNGVRGKLSAVVGDDHARTATYLDDAIEFASNTKAGEGVVGDEREAFSAELVDDRQNAESPAVDQRIRQKVEAPALVCSLRDGDRRTGPQRSFASAALAHRQPLLLVEPVQLLAVQKDALPFQQNVQPAVTKAPTLRRQRTQSLPQTDVIWAQRGIAISLRLKPHQPTGPTLRITSLSDRPAHSLPPCTGR